MSVCKKPLRIEIMPQLKFTIVIFVGLLIIIPNNIVTKINFSFQKITTQI